MTKRTRKIVRIDEDKCDGCGLCVPDCAEGAIQIINGKARLVAENLCDGLGNCLGACPNDAITIEERPAEELDEAAVRTHLQQRTADKPDELPCGCPGTMMRKLNPAAALSSSAQSSSCDGASRPSRLSHWPVQLTLLPVGGGIWQDADVLIAADCVGFAMPDFHERLLAGDKKTLVIACPKLDDVEPYVDKLASVFANNTIQSVTVAHMEVPCCSGIVAVVKEAMERSGRTDIRLRDVTVGVGGSIVNERQAT